MISSCSNREHKTEIKGKNQLPIIKTSQTDNDSQFENEVISEIIQAVIDSLNNRIKVDLGKDYKSYKFINVPDTLVDFGEYGGMNVDSINMNKKIRSKLEIIDKKLKEGKEIRFVSTFNEYSNLTDQDNANRMLLGFSRVHFNKRYDECVLNVALSSHINAGEDYAIYAKKENNRWILKLVQLSAIR